jgi:HD-GYP domain-containing protein (c-di-GMP phosphodiesterase class II)
MIQVSRAIGTIHDQRQLMTTIMDEVDRAFIAERASLYIHDESRRELWTLVAQGLDEGAVKEIRIPDDFGLSGRVFQTQESLCIADTFTDPHFARRIASTTGYEPHSMLIAPVIGSAGQCHGVLQVMDHRISHFSEGDLPLLEAIAVQVGITLENARLHEAQKRQFRSFVTSLSTALDARDPLTAIHSVNVANYAVAIGLVMDLPAGELESLRIAGLVHDIGKIGVPEAILTKSGKLTAEEYEEMKRHAEHSREILSKIEFTEDLQGLDFIAASHHEKLDGSGYPGCLADAQIPMMARIVAVADIYDALTQTRHYRRSMSMHEAFGLIDGMTPHELDPRCVGALRAFLGVGPWPMA